MRKPKNQVQIPQNINTVYKCIYFIIFANFLIKIGQVFRLAPRFARLASLGTCQAPDFANFNSKIGQTLVTLLQFCIIVKIKALGGHLYKNLISIVCWLGNYSPRPHGSYMGRAQFFMHKIIFIKDYSNRFFALEQCSNALLRMMCGIWSFLAYY